METYSKLTLHRCWGERFYSWILLKKEEADFNHWMLRFNVEVSRFKHNAGTNISYLLMVIWRGIYLVDPPEPSTHLLHTALEKRSIQTLKTKTLLNVLFTIQVVKMDILILYYITLWWNTVQCLTSRWSVELDHKLVESTKDGDLMLALDADVRLRKKTSNTSGRKIQTILNTFSTTMNQTKLLVG